MGKHVKVRWSDEDVFAIKLLDGCYSLGQILDKQLPNVVRVALYNEKHKDLNTVNTSSCCDKGNLVSLVACSTEQLDFGEWKIVGNSSLAISKKDFPNEEFRNSGWIGSKHYDAALVEDFLNAFYSLSYWDDWFDPCYLDQFLIDESIKPKNLLFKSK